MRVGFTGMAALMVACTGGDPGAGDDAVDTDTAAPDDTAAAVDDTAVAPDDTGEVDAPAIAVAVDADVHNALRVDVTGPGVAPSGTATVTAAGGDPEQRPLVPVATADGAWSARVVGLYADTDYTVEVDGLLASARTEPLPVDLPPISLTVRDDARASDGLTVFPVARWAPVADAAWGYLVAVDELGEVVWWHRTGSLAIGLQVAPDADGFPVVYTTDFVGEVVAVTMATGAVQRLAATDLGLDTVHHEVRPLDDGGLALLSSEVRSLTGWGGETYNIVGDVLVEATWDGTVLWSTSILDHVDPTSTYTADMHMAFWDIPPYLGVVDTPKDWSHGNAIEPDPAADAWIGSFRNLDWLVSFDRTTGGVNWAFGPGGDFTLAEGGRWSSRQHAPKRTDAGTWLVYDNGNARADAAPDETPYSRVVEYELDTERMVATELWSYAAEEPYFCPIVGDVDRLAPDRHLITDGAIIDGFVDVDGTSVPHFSARVREVVGVASPEVVFEVVVGTPDDLETDGVTVYRAEHIPALTP